MEADYNPDNGILPEQESQPEQDFINGDPDVVDYHDSDAENDVPTNENTLVNTIDVPISSSGEDSKIDELKLNEITQSPSSLKKLCFDEANSKEIIDALRFKRHRQQRRHINALVYVLYLYQQ